MRITVRILTLVLLGSLSVLMHPELLRAEGEILDQAQTAPGTSVWSK